MCDLANSFKLISLLWPSCVADADILFYVCGIFFFLSHFLLAYSQPLQIGCLPYFYCSTRNVAFIVRIWNAGLKCAARGLLKIENGKKSSKNRSLRAIAQLCRAVSSQLRHASTIGKTC